MADVVAATPINPQRHQDLTIAAANATPISTAKLNIMDAKMSVHTHVIVIYNHSNNILHDCNLRVL